MIFWVIVILGFIIWIIIGFTHQHCHYCKKIISSRSKVCPHCKKENPFKK